ncbi:SDR family oxidoreductase [Streptomyces parvus]|uniref:SDR family oxidoreductase n=1 Tax=Streptomyces parvus TaxID=66428 RepID=UPI00370997E7
MRSAGLRVLRRGLAQHPREAAAGGRLPGQGPVAETAEALSTLGKVGTPAEIADVVAFLASDDGRWVTGHWIDATGGSPA